MTAEPFNETALTSISSSAKAAKNEGSNFADNALRAKRGQRADAATFKNRLEELVRQSLDTGNLERIPRETVAALVNGGGSALKQSADTLSTLVSLGQLNQATYLNVSGFTGDTLLLRSALNVYRGDQHDDDIEPVHEIDEYVG
jgi:hypothetical protein